MKKFSIALVSLLFPALILAQNSVSGTVTDATSGQALAGANVVLEGTSLGAAADADGADEPDEHGELLLPTTVGSTTSFRQRVR